MKKIIYLLMSLSFVALVSCEDKEKSSSENRTGIENGHEWVDLGLPSGTLWATCNVGASRPQDYGCYYAWGEVSPKSNYSWSNYLDGKIIDENDCWTSKDALKDIRNIAGTQYDAAYVNWGGKWRMPTKEQVDELRNDCYWVWVNSYNGSNVNGYIVYKAKSSSDKGDYLYSGDIPFKSYSLSDAHIFLPAAGYRSDCDLYDTGSHGFFWSSSLLTQCLARRIHFYSILVQDYFDYRCYGQSVRAVIPGE